MAPKRALALRDSRSVTRRCAFGEREPLYRCTRRIRRAGVESERWIRGSERVLSSSVTANPSVVSRACSVRCPPCCDIEHQPAACILCPALREGVRSAVGARTAPRVNRRGDQRITARRRCALARRGRCRDDGEASMLQRRRHGPVCSRGDDRRDALHGKSRPAIVLFDEGVARRATGAGAMVGRGKPGRNDTRCAGRSARRCRRKMTVTAQWRSPIARPTAAAERAFWRRAVNAAVVGRGSVVFGDDSRR